MSAAGFLEKLLDGAEVVWKPLGDIAQYSTTRIGSNQLNESNYVGVDNLLQNRAGRVNSDYVPTSGNLTEFKEGDVLIGNIRPYLRKIWHADRRGGTNGDVLVVHPTDSVLNSRYLFQVLTDENFFEYNIQHSKGAKMPRGSKPHILQYLVPIPCPDDPVKSLAIQGEIVRILDSFTELTAELAAELAQRKKQYNHYRNQLLTFDEDEVEWKTLGDIGRFTYGYAAVAEDQGDARFIRITDIGTNGKLIADEKKFVSVNKESKKYLLKRGDLLMARTGATFGKTMIFEKSYPAIFAGFLIKLDLCGDVIDPKYYWHFSQSDMFWRQANRLVSGGGQPQFNANTLKQVRVPIPFPGNPQKSLDEQVRIVAILDKFDSLANSLTEGLPREIALRERQYAFYRNQLLNFPKLNAEAA